MSIRVALHHLTEYSFDRSVAVLPHIFRLRPAAHSRTPIEAYSLKILPENHFINWQQDPFGNFLARAVFPEPTRRLRIEVELIAELTVINPFDFFIDDDAQETPFTYSPQLRKDLSAYLIPETAGPLLREWLKREVPEKDKTVDFLVAVNRALYQHLSYTTRLEPGVQSVEGTLSIRSGSCRDSAWLLVQIFRHIGIAARFVSGYLVQLKPDEKPLDGPAGPEKDFTDLHAWAEVYIPGAGWIGLDPTSGLLASEGHIPLACTPDPISAAPIEGSTGPCEVSFSFQNNVKRLHEDPRVTRPYSPDQWQSINALGRKVDKSLQSNDVRLSMGGEPTFVSIDDMEGAEWNIAADGPTKRKLSHKLILRLQKAFATDSVLHFGEGKWYPGEELPRWSLSCFWRRDGLPLWKNPALLADTTQDLGHDHKDAERFLLDLAKRLGVSPSYVRPGYEDVFYYLWKEGTLPENIDPHKADLDDPLERRYLADLLGRGLEVPAGYALPLHWHEVRECWRSAQWDFNRAEMFLIPGGSPMGFRLPLNSLPWTAPEKRPIATERSPLEDLPDLGNPAETLASRFLFPPVETPMPWLDQSEADDAEFDEAIPHTALCVQARNGRVYIFLPPVSHLERYLELLSAIEHTAEATGIPVVIEGYEPPTDPRLEVLRVTPDPGVIEVNVHPATSWDQLVNITQTLYREAREARLGTEKFMLDGRHVGTGGGNHITIGGITPKESPFFRRPSLLRSLLTYWQHHPGLSYLFSGLFVGPTSQAPRVDEGRDDKLYELEIAFQQLSDEEPSSPWMVDRILRHLLTDLTGNTHRAEFCIDKLYSPDRQSGRLGLVELRAFEMPPHPEMSLVQQLLLRSLIALFWEKPYQHRLVRWGTGLHDRFMLKHFVRKDLEDVVLDLQRGGIPFQLDWLDPFFEFRFPHCGRVICQGIKLDISVAIEPWHVLGEETSSTGTARYVDSSVERVEVAIQGMTNSRYLLTCNGRRVPLTPTGVQGEFVAGVRFKAWDPHSALHPSIGIQHPLVFDFFDTWSGRSIGGCVYHVSHPGGLSYDKLPVNAFEAESRRVSRFWKHGHTPGSLEPLPELAGLQPFVNPLEEVHRPLLPPVEDINESYPLTLDLRRQRSGSLGDQPSA